VIFRRTRSGIANLHLFFRVDQIVFCEGGEQIALAAVLSGEGDVTTLDCYFWCRVAQYVGARQTYHFKSIGSKTTLKQLAEDIANGSIATAIVCLDRDFDWHCHRHLAHHRVAYTFGYSWENDATSEIALEGVLFRLFPQDAGTLAILAKAANEIERLRRALRPWCETEIALSSQDKKLVFDREKPLASINLQGKIPRFSEDRARKMLSASGYQRRPRCKVKVTKNDALRHGWGKMVSRFYYQLFSKLVGQISAGFRLSYDLFMRLMIAETFDAMSKGGLVDMAAHYRTYSTTFA
jgi:hypothetical protein